MEASQDRVFFADSDGASREGMWRSDGSTSGSVLAKAFESWADSQYAESNPSYLPGVGRSLLFVAADAAHGEELWKSDGRRAGTVLVKDIMTGSSPRLVN